jgi:hypothetical protein
MQAALNDDKAVASSYNLRHQLNVDLFSAQSSAARLNALANRSKLIIRD